MADVTAPADTDTPNEDMGKLAMWRLQTHGAFGGTWLSDYVPNRLGGFRSARQENPRPLCPLLGQDGNIFHLMGIAARVLRQNGMAAEAKEMQTRIMGGACHSYAEALGNHQRICGDGAVSAQRKSNEKVGEA